MPKVIIWRDGAIETEFDPGHRDWRLGRSETNDITLLDPRKSVSRFHAELREENGRWVFIDLNSQNGSWKDGLRVNRLVLEHGHEVLFGDYRLVFEDARVAPPPPVPPTVDVTFDVSRPTVDEPVAPDQTLLTPSRPVTPVPVTTAPAPTGSLSTGPISTGPISTGPVPTGSVPTGSVSTGPAPTGPVAAVPVPAVPSPPIAAMPPVARPPAPPMAPRKGINPLILVAALVVMLGAMAAVAWMLLSNRTVDPQVVRSADQTPPQPIPEPTPEVQAPAPEGDPPVDTPAPVPDGPPAPSTSLGAEEPPAPLAPVILPPAPSAPASKATSASKAAPGPGSVARPKRTPPATPVENPATVARYEAGRRALTAGRFGEAERAFQAVLAQQPGFRDAGARLAEAREGLVAARTTALAEAAAREANEDWPAAVAAYERAGASDQAAAARAKMAAAGDDAYRKARQFDARNRPTEAIGWYQRAAAWLPDSDARKATAQERLTALRGGGE